MHAFKDTHKDAFWPWLKKHLEDRGAKVYAPDLPNPDKPNIEQQVDYVLANHKFRKTTVVITHSLGGVLAMKLLPHLPGQIKHLIMAAPPLRTEFLDGKKREELKDCCDWKFDFKAIKSNAEKITVIRDSKDNIVPPGQPEEIAENLSANLINVEAKSPHFNGTEEPAVLEIAVPKIKIFTTRPDTLFGATYMVLAPEHPLVVEITTADKKQEVQKYIETTKAKTELQRTALEKDKTGVFTGAFAVNPATNEKIPVWIADYVLMNYGTGAIMAVPAHDERDFAFAKKYVLPTLQVITPKANCIILHGCPSSNENDPAKRTYDKHWIPWTKAELEKRGIKTFTPLMPNPWNPVYADWKAEFEKLPVNESTILVGHSCAAAFLTKWLGETKRPVGKLIFVGGARIARQGDHRKDELYLGEISSDIKNKVKDVRLLISNDDPRHIEATKIYAKELNGRIIEVPSRGHFTFKDMGTNELPELLREILGTGKVTTDYGILINSGKFDGLTSEKAKWEITKAVGGQRKIQYKLRDWLVSRQRYWGAPIPIIYCEKCGMQAVPEKDLPVKLPTDVDFKPTGESPLARSKEFHKVKCPNCNEPARRDSDTMDTFVDSSWYFLRFADPHNNKAFSDKKEIKKWLPVDLYVGGAEHAVLHLLYARFITKALADFKLLNFQEPFLKLRNQGLILGPDGEKMSKSRGNVINPDDVIEEFGADSLRLYELFMGPLEDAKPWSTRGIIGVRRFLDRVWNFQEEFKQGEPVRAIHGLTKKVSSDVETFKFNTAIAAFMEFLNENPAMSRENWETFLKLLAPFAPHITEELWENLGHKKSIHLEHWPKFEEKLAQDENVTIVVQVLGRVRATMQMPRDMAREDIKQKALNDPNVKKHLEGKEIVKEIFVKDKLINFVVK
ncbi:MAG TPA: class I tRNA ligase family protein [Patescibacteria group bacterium]|nr:class I tRNA ligase family protein [Patescibacteria group bacterium]